MSARWYAVPANLHRQADVRAAGEIHGPLAPVVLLALYDLACEQGNTGRVVTGPRALAAICFTSPEAVSATLDTFASLRTLDVMPASDDEAYVGPLAVDVNGWADMQAVGCNAIRRERSLRPHTPRRLRLAVLRRDGYACRWCGAVAAQDTDGTTMPPGFELDHVYPYSRGGEHTLDNLQVLCGPCNRRKGARLA